MPRASGFKGRLAAIALMALVACPGRAWAVSDPLEPLNRAVFRLNDAMLDHVIYPLGVLARTWVSPHAREAAHNVYNNLSETEFILTNLLQGDLRNASLSVGRFAVNSTVGIGGLYDPATRLGLVAREPEFSEAVCSLGVRAGAYLVVPLVGPTNLNSTAVLGALWVGELYLLSMASNVLVAADVVIDTAVGAAMLRHSVDPIDAGGADPYKVQRSQYSQYIATACTTPPSVRPRA